MTPLNKIEQGCGEKVKFVPYGGKVICGDTFNDKLRLCPSCKALLKQTEEIIKEIDKVFPNNWLNPLMKNLLEKKEISSCDVEQLLLKIKKELRQKIIGKEADLQEKK